MTRHITLIFASLVLFVLFPAPFTSGAETSRTCALTKAFECTVENGCRELSIREMALPRFIRIDLKAKAIQSLDTTVDRTTPFKDSDSIDGLLVLHGTEKRGWSMAVGEKSGDLTLSASGDRESFVVFGSCISP
ncbi:MAG: hypothetical protein EG824_09665 [Deltaproteobacteria bacterium]|nr:hypothetical protein [Deltaproteobacteria bacterium]